MAQENPEVVNPVLVASTEETPEKPEELLMEADRLGIALRALIVRCKALPRLEAKLDPYQRPERALQLAQEHLQSGMLWLRKCILQDTRF